MDGRSTRWVTLLRPAVFAAAPQEPLLLPVVTSTLFPQLSQSYRNPFRMGMGIMLLGVVVFSLLGLRGPLVTLVALGVPSLFVLYLWQAELLRDIPVRSFVLAVAMGCALGTGWVWWTGDVVARSYGIPVAAGLMMQNVFGVGLIISIGGMFLMALPAVVVRMTLGRREKRRRESLDGFVVGVLGALSFAGAATTTRLAPQFVAGLIEQMQPARMLIKSVLYGIAVPLTAAAVGGVVGTLLWFRPGRRAGEHPRLLRSILVIFALIAVAIYAAIWVIDASRLPKWPQLALHVVMTVIAVLTARFCVQLALLHEEPDHFNGRPMLCVHCDRVVPDMPFCPACGAAARASSRSLRRHRRASPPTYDSNV